MAFIDYQKAYDKVNRLKLLQYLDQKGCGNTFLQAIQRSMQSTLLKPSCVLSALIYGTETWLTDNFKQLDILYGRIIRALLGVKHSTPIDLCLIEAGMNPLKNIIMERRRIFMANKVPILTLDDPLGYCLNLTRGIKGRQLRAFRSYEGYLPINTCERIKEPGR